MTWYEKFLKCNFTEYTANQLSQQQNNKTGDKQKLRCEKKRNLLLPLTILVVKAILPVLLLNIHSDSKPFHTERLVTNQPAATPNFLLTGILTGRDS